MLRVITACLLLGAAGACAAPATSPRPATASAQACPLRIAFGSYAMGIDRAAFDNIRALLAGERSVRRIDEQRWGREGEVTLCVTTGKPRQVARAVERVLPADPRGPITVETRDGLRIERARPPAG